MSLSRSLVFRALSRWSRRRWSCWPLPRRFSRSKHPEGGDLFFFSFFFSLLFFPFSSSFLLFFSSFYYLFISSSFITCFSVSFPGFRGGVLRYQLSNESVSVSKGFLVVSLRYFRRVSGIGPSLTPFEVWGPLVPWTSSLGSSSLGNHDIYHLKCRPSSVLSCV